MECKLGNVVNFKNGKKKPNSKGNIPIYGGNGILGYTDKYNANNNSIIIGRVGAYCGCVYKCEHECWVSDNAILGQVKENYDYMYVYYLMKTLNINDLHVGSGQPLMTQDILNNIIVDIPCYSDQVKIGKILNDIDKKIELNNQINNNLYDLGDALYKEYYLRFINKLPKGYEVRCLSEVAQNFDSKRRPMSSRERKLHHGVYPYYGATSIIDYVDNYIFDDTYVLMGEDGTVKNENGNPVLQYIWGKNWVNNHAHVLKGIKISTEHLYFALRNINVEALITGAVQPKINQENMNKIQIVIGNKEINNKFEIIIKNIMNKSKQLVEENKLLKHVRDNLLPKLMNGEIDLDKI